jgi:hypothetical protein
MLAAASPLPSLARRRPSPPTEEEKGHPIWQLPQGPKLPHVRAGPPLISPLLELIPPSSSC